MVFIPPAYGCVIATDSSQSKCQKTIDTCITIRKIYQEIVVQYQLKVFCMINGPLLRGLSKWKTKYLGKPEIDDLGEAKDLVQNVAKIGAGDTLLDGIDPSF